MKRQLCAQRRGSCAAFVDDLGGRVEPVRERLFAAVGVFDPHVAKRGALVQAVDERFGSNRPLTYAHVLLGAADLRLRVAAVLGRIRRRYLAYHRWTGGRAESFVIGLAGVVFVFAILRGFVAIWRRDREAHRVWMTRAFAIGLRITVLDDSRLRSIAPGGLRNHDARRRNGGCDGRAVCRGRLHWPSTRGDAQTWNFPWSNSPL